MIITKNDICNDGKQKNIINDKVRKDEVLDNNGTNQKYGLEDLFFSPFQLENVLRLLIVGHNPSEKSWQRGHYYANPANRMWNLLRVANIVPSTFIHENDVDCPSECGVGFTDLMSGIPETKSSSFTFSDTTKWKKSLYNRIESHVLRVSKIMSKSLIDSCPKVIAFAGVKQWKALFPPNYNFHVNLSSSNIEDFIIHEAGTKRKYQLFGEGDKASSEKSIFGVQRIRPPDWPKALSSCVVFVLPSSSGAAALTNVEREGPYIELGKIINEQWPIESWRKAVTVSDQSRSAESSEYGVVGNAIIDLSTED
eukprot:gene26111-34719_t